MHQGQKSATGERRHLEAEQERLREEVRRFAQTEVAPRIEAMEAAPGSVDRELSALIAAQGWIGATIAPDPYRGMGAGHVAKTIIIEELSRVNGAMGAMVQASQLGVAKVDHYGSQEQKRTWLPRFADGSCLPTIAVTETGSGGHVLGMQATAERHGADYILTGRKVFVGNSHIAHVHGVVVRTEPVRRRTVRSASRRSPSLSAFLVEKDTPGLTLAPLRPTLGLHGFSFGELILDRCRIPAANRVGAEGDGLAVAYSSSVLYGRPNLTAVALGIHQAIVDETVQFAQDRRRYGAPLAALPTIEQQLGLMTSRLMTARTAAYHAVQLLDEGKACDAELMNAKYQNVELLLDSARTAMKIHAAAGLLMDRPLQRFVRDAWHTDPPAGTGDIQLLRLGEPPGRRQWSQRLPRPLHRPT